MVKTYLNHCNLSLKNPTNCNQDLRFCVEKMFFRHHFYFPSKTHPICSILTKYEPIIPKTLKVTLIFRFLTCVKKKQGNMPVNKKRCYMNGRKLVLEFLRHRLRITLTNGEASFENNLS